MCPLASTKGGSISSGSPDPRWVSLPQGITRGRQGADRRGMSAPVLTEAAPAAASRLLADVNALDESDPREREPAIERLEAALSSKEHTSELQSLIRLTYAA